MSVKLTGKLTDPLSTELVHHSGAKVETTVPKVLGGKEDLFSPTDLVAAALGACVMTTLSLWAKKHDVPLEEIEFEMEKKYNPKPPYACKSITVVYKLKTSADDETYEKLISIAKSCPVRNSLNPDIEISETFERL